MATIYYKSGNNWVEIGNNYPVGSIYISLRSTSPATLFGGTWTKIESRFLFGATDASDEKHFDTTSPGKEGGYKYVYAPLFLKSGDSSSNYSRIYYSYAYIMSKSNGSYFGPWIVPYFLKNTSGWNSNTELLIDNIKNSSFKVYTGASGHTIDSTVSQHGNSTFWPQKTPTIDFSTNNWQSSSDNPQGIGEIPMMMLGANESDLSEHAYPPSSQTAMDSNNNNENYLYNNSLHYLMDNTYPPYYAVNMWRRTA